MFILLSKTRESEQGLTADQCHYAYRKEGNDQESIQLPNTSKSVTMLSGQQQTDLCS